MALREDAQRQINLPSMEGGAREGELEYGGFMKFVIQIFEQMMFQLKGFTAQIIGSLPSVMSLQL